MDIPGFQIKRTIGRGGMATVYLAVQESLGREVCLKIMPTSKGDSSSFVERFMNEGRIIAALQHPHIITIYDIGTAPDLVWISMEYVNGGDLKNRIDLGMNPLEALELLANIGSALDFAHKHGIIHRDVKPQNILFRRDGTALLSDFGIAKEMQIDVELTSTGTILGSPYYMSPEQAEGMKVDGRTDIYSLGIIFYEMLTGERPYPGDTAIKVIMQHIQSPVPTLPEDLQRYQPLLDKIMCKETDQRTPTAAALVAEAEALHKKLHQEMYPSATSEEEAKEIQNQKDRLQAEKRKWRLTILGACFVMLILAFASLQVYVESLKASRIVKPRLPETEVAQPLDAQASVNSQSNSADATGTSAGLSKEEVVKALTWLAENSLRENRLTYPPADNAYYYFSRLLALDPGNETAKHGFGDIAERYTELAEREFSNNNFGKAQAYIALGLQVRPDHVSLLNLQAIIADRDKSVLDKFFEFLKGIG
jgi:serine/threonine-protein kinase PpkA